MVERTKGAFTVIPSSRVGCRCGDTEGMDAEGVVEPHGFRFHCPACGLRVIVELTVRVFLLEELAGGDARRKLLTTVRHG